MLAKRHSSSRRSTSPPIADRPPSFGITLRHALQQRSVLLGATGFAVFFWVLHAVIDSLFMRHRPVLDVLLLSVEPHQLVARLLMLAVFWGFGLFAAAMVARCRMTAEVAQTIGQRNRAMLAAFPDLIFVLNRDGVIVDVEAEGLASRLVLPPEQVIGSHLEDVTQPENVAHTMRAIRDALDTGQTQQLDYEVPYPDGVHWYEARVVATGPDEVLAIMRDVTIKRKTEAALQDSAARFRAASQGSLDSFFILEAVRDANGQIEDFVFVHVNERGAATMGLPPDQMLGERICELFPINRTGGFFDKYCQVCETGEPLVENFTIPAEHAAPGWYRHQVIPLENGVAITTQDITAQKHTELALIEEAQVNAQFAALSQALLDTHDLAEITTHVLETAQTLTGSQFGYVGYIDPQTGHLICPTMTRDIWDQCQVPDKSIIFEQFGGLWGWVLDHRQAMYTNNPHDDIRSTGTPPGHIPIERFLSVPAVIDKELVGQIALANPPHDYTGHDLEQIKRLAAIYALAVQRKHSEDQLRFQAQLLDSVRESVVATDLDGNVIYWGKGAETLYGYSAQEALGQSITMIVQPENVDEELARIWQVREQGAWEGRYEQRRKDGTPFHADTRIGLVRDENGAPFALIGVDRDVSEQVRRTEELRANEARFRGVVEHSQDGICLIDKAGVLIEWNHACEKITGLARSEVLGRNIWDVEQQLTPPEYWTEELGERIRQATFEMLRTGQMPWKSEPGERVIKRLNDEQRIVQSTVFVVPHVDGFLACRIVRDVTELHTAQKQQMKLHLEQERVRLLTNFIEAASHEYRTPLAVIHTGLDVLEHRIPEDEKNQEILNRVKAYVMYFGNLVTATLKMSRLDSDVSLELEPVDINQVVSEVHESILSRAQRKAQQMRVELLKEPVVIQADPYDLQDALTHLLQNAVDFTPEGGEIAVQVLRENQHLEVRVQDSGIGIGPEHLPHIFERFYRTDQARTDRRAGMGLAIARKIINLHGGDITVESAPGAGSTFTVVLPLEPG